MQLRQVYVKLTISSLTMLGLGLPAIAQDDPCAAAARDWAAVSAAASEGTIKAFASVHSACPIYKALADEWLAANTTAAAPAPEVETPAVPEPALEPEAAAAPEPVLEPAAIEAEAPAPGPEVAEPAPQPAPATDIVPDSLDVDVTEAALPAEAAPVDPELEALAGQLAYIGPKAEAAARAGDANALFDLAALYSTDLGGNHDPTAAALMEAACGLDLAQSCAALGFMMLEGRGVAEDAAGAAALFDTACAGGIARACSRLASLYEIGIGVEKDLDRAEALFERTLEFDPDNALALTQLTALRAPAETPASEPAAEAAPVKPAESLSEALASVFEAEWTSKLAQIGPQVAGFIRARDIENMRVVARFHELNEEAAFRFELPAAIYEVACNLDDAESCRNYGEAAQAGTGLAASDEVAAAFFERACELDDAAGCHALATAYAEGQGVSRDGATAVTYFDKGCTLGSGEACRSLSQYYAFGQGGLTQDRVKSYELLIKACRQDSAQACFSVGVGIQNGTFVAPEGDTADTYFDKAVALDSALQTARDALGSGG